MSYLVQPRSEAESRAGLAAAAGHLVKPRPGVKAGRERWRQIALLFAVWSAPGLLYALETKYSWSLEGMPVALWRTALYQMPSWYVWVPATPLVVRLARSFPLARRERFLRALLVHLVTCLGIGLAYGVVRAVVAPWSLPDALMGKFHERTWHTFVMWVPATALTYAAVFAAATAILHARAAQQRAVEAAELTASLSRAQLGALRAQIHPHFLFNALHTAAGVVREREPEQAVEVLSTLAEILRDTFRGSPEREIPLREELAWITRYLSIQKARFRERLEIVWRIDENTLDARVPQLVLQPLVENAFQHGIARRPGAGRLELSAAREGDALVLLVRDDGPVFSATPASTGAASSSDEHTGLANTRARIELLYGTAASLTLSAAPDTGATATVVLPFHTSSAPPASSSE